MFFSMGWAMWSKHRVEGMTGFHVRLIVFFSRRLGFQPHSIIEPPVAFYLSIAMTLQVWLIQG